MNFVKIFLNRILSRQFAKFAALLFIMFFCGGAHAEWGIVDSLNLAPFVPMVLDALMSVATAGYDFFIGRGDGIIYILIWGFLGVSMSLYLVKMYFPKTWISFFGFQGGGELWEGKIGGLQIAENLLKPAMRAILAATLFLQVKPVYVTEFLVDPFLQFGAIYTKSITDSISTTGGATFIECPAEITKTGWISKDGCDFLIQPISTITHENNKIIKRGFEFITRGLSGLMGLIPNGGESFLNIITGILLVSAFVSSNFFMALLIIQGIFNFGMALILYPFQVLIYVAKPSKPDSWIDPWQPFSEIIKSLQKLVITMIACAFILAINIAIIKSLFRWNTSVFVVASGGMATTNVPAPIAGGAMGFGEHSIIWLSTVLTFYLMLRIFELTKSQLEKYTGGGMDALYKQVSLDAKSTWKNTQKLKKQITDAFESTGKKK